MLTYKQLKYVKDYIVLIGQTQHLLSFSPGNPKDLTQLFPVEINGIPYGCAFCMFPGPVAKEEHGIDNLTDVGSRSQTKIHQFTAFGALERTDTSLYATGWQRSKW